MPFHVGQRVAGTYLGKAFAGEIIGLNSLADKTRFCLTQRFDDAVDVIEFDSMSNFRKQVQAMVDRTGRTAETTSNGLPHLALDMRSGPQSSSCPS